MNTREKFQQTFTVASYETDFTGKMELFSLFNHFQELAGNHAEYLQVGYDLLRDSGLAWILSRIKLQIHALPKWRETVILETWPKGIDKLFALRDFRLKNSEGEVLVLATSCWLLVEIEKGRPKRLEKLPIDLTFPNAVHAISELPDKLQLPENMTKVFEKNIWISDLDVNYHVNNAQYVKWICDCFSDNKFRSQQIDSIQINFLNETTLKDKIELQISPSNEEACEFYICGKTLIKDSVSFHSRITWR